MLMTSSVSQLLRHHASCIMTAPCGLQTFFFETLEPNDFDTSVLQLLSTLTLDEIVRFADTDETSTDLGFDEGVGAGRET